MNTKIIDKLKKLLALAGNNADEKEANAAMEKAIAIAIENNIEISKLQKEEMDEIIKDDSGYDAARLPITQRFVNDILQSFFDVMLVLGGSRKTGRKLFFIGRSEKVEFAKYLNNYLNETFMSLWQSFYKRNSHLSVKGARASYFMGLYRGLKERLQAQKDAMLANCLPSSSDKERYAMVIVNEKQALENAMKNFFSTLRAGAKKSYDNLSKEIIENGKRDSANIQIHSGLNGEEILALE